MKRFPFSYFLLLASSALCSVALEDGRHTGHTHYQPEGKDPSNILHDKKFVRDYEHVKEDLQDLYNKDFADSMDDEDLEIYYFQLHDLNNDKRLDGLELLASMNHVMERSHESFSKKDLEENPNVRQSLQMWWNVQFEQDAKFIDEILKEEDTDQDGYVSYLEYIVARRKDREEK